MKIELELLGQDFKGLGNDGEQWLESNKDLIRRALLEYSQDLINDLHTITKPE